jgi:hypothetical protein
MIDFFPESIRYCAEFSKALKLDQPSTIDTINVYAFRSLFLASEGVRHFDVFANTKASIAVIVFLLPRLPVPYCMHVRVLLPSDVGAISEGEDSDDGQILFEVRASS